MGHLLRTVGNTVVGSRHPQQGLITSNLESEFTGVMQGQQSPMHVDPVHPVSSVSFTKVADRIIKRGNSALDVTRNAPLFNDPRYTSSTLAIPTDDRTLHGLYRFFADTDPIVGAALRIHTELPMANLQLSECEDAGVQQHFEEMAERINLIRTLTDGVKEYWTIGNDYFFGAWNEKDYMFDQFTLLNPDYVKVESTWLNQKPLVKLIPDEGLKKIVQTRSPDYLYKQLSPEIIRYVLYNNEIPLHPNNVFILSHDKAPYEVKGKSLIKRLLKILMYEDRLQQAQFAIATRHIVPLTIVKVGDPNTGWIPEASELDSLRDMFAAWEMDPNFSIFYHYGINVEFYGSSGKILPVGPEFDRVYKLKFIGMGIHEQLMTGGGGSYAQAYANLEIQRQRYLNLQLKVEQMVHVGWFKTVAEMCGFYRVARPVVGSYYRGKAYGSAKDAGRDLMKAYAGIRDYKDNEEFREFFTKKSEELRNNELAQRREYIYPKLDWGAMSATNDENYKNWIKWLRKEVPWLIDEATLARIARLDPTAQEKAYFRDIERRKERESEIIRQGLAPWAEPKKPGGSPTGEFDGGAGMDIGPMDALPPGGGDMGGGGGDLAGAGLGAPGAPIGAGGPPAGGAAAGAPPGAPPTLSAKQSPSLEALASEMLSTASVEDTGLFDQNRILMTEHPTVEQQTIDKAVGI
jgi:hypothetical protein